MDEADDTENQRESEVLIGSTRGMDDGLSRS